MVVRKRQEPGRKREERETMGRLVFGMIAPKPAHGIRENRAAMFAVVGAIAIFELVIVTGKFQRSRHLLIGQGPVAMGVVQVIASVLEKDSQRFAFSLPNQGRVDMSAADVGETANVADHLAK